MAFADVRDVMDLRSCAAPQGCHADRRTASRNSKSRTGINIETDIDRVLACIGAGSAVHGTVEAGMVVAAAASTP